MRKSDAMSRQATRFKERYGPWAIVAGASEGLGAAWSYGGIMSGVIRGRYVEIS